MSGLEKALKAAGGVSALARALGVSAQAVSQWEKVPADRVIAVSSITRIRPFDLRPDLYPDPTWQPPEAA